MISSKTMLEVTINSKLPVIMMPADKLFLEKTSAIVSVEGNIANSR